MMSKLAAPVAFFAGLAIGGAAVWCCAKEKYARITEQEIASVKEAYARREQKQGRPDAPTTPVPSRPSRGPNRESSPMSSPRMNLGKSRSIPR